MLLWLNVSCFLHQVLRRPLSSLCDSAYSFYATTASGLESVLAAEVKLLPDVSLIEQSNCGVHFCGSLLTGLTSLMNLRTSLKLLELIADSDRVESRDDLSWFIDDIDWSLIIESHQSIKVDVTQGLNLPPDLTHSHFTALSVKNAVVDQFRHKTGDRPSVDIDHADLPLLLYLHRGTACLYRAWSGCHSMHKRGYRADSTVHKAALRETTAAAILSLAGWSSSSARTLTLSDPMCGSGTIAIEAALIACGTGPGLLRYGVSSSGEGEEPPCPLRWKDLQVEGIGEMWSSVVKAAQLRDTRRSRSSSSGLIRGSDIHTGSLQLARQAAQRAGVDHMIRFDQCSADLADPPPSPSLLVTNPPWDRRLSEGCAESAWTQLGIFARKCGVDTQSDIVSSGGASSALYALSGSDELPPLMRLSRGSVRKKHAFNAAGTKMKLHEYR